MLQLESERNKLMESTKTMVRLEVQDIARSYFARLLSSAADLYELDWHSAVFQRLLLSYVDHWQKQV